MINQVQALPEDTFHIRCNNGFLSIYRSLPHLLIVAAKTPC